MMFQIHSNRLTVNGSVCIHSSAFVLLAIVQSLSGAPQNIRSFEMLGFELLASLSLLQTKTCPVVVYDCRQCLNEKIMTFVLMTILLFFPCSKNCSSSNYSIEICL